MVQTEIKATLRPFVKTDSIICSTCSQSRTCSSVHICIWVHTYHRFDQPLYEENGMKSVKKLRQGLDGAETEG